MGLCLLDSRNAVVKIKFLMQIRRKRRLFFLIFFYRFLYHLVDMIPNSFKFIQLSRNGYQTEQNFKLFRCSFAFKVELLWYTGGLYPADSADISADTFSTLSIIFAETMLRVGTPLLRQFLARMTLWAFICWPSSQVRVASALAVLRVKVVLLQHTETGLQEAESTTL